MAGIIDFQDETRKLVCLLLKADLMFGEPCLSFFTGWLFLLRLFSGSVCRAFFLLVLKSHFFGQFLHFWGCPYSKTYSSLPESSKNRLYPLIKRGDTALLFTMVGGIGCCVVTMQKIAKVRGQKNGQNRLPPPRTVSQVGHSQQSSSYAPRQYYVHVAAPVPLRNHGSLARVASSGQNGSCLQEGTLEKNFFPPPPPDQTLTSYIS